MPSTFSPGGVPFCSGVCSCLVPGEVVLGSDGEGEPLTPGEPEVWSPPVRSPEPAELSPLP